MIRVKPLKRFFKRIFSQEEIQGGIEGNDALVI